MAGLDEPGYSHVSQVSRLMGRRGSAVTVVEGSTVPALAARRQSDKTCLMCYGDDARPPAPPNPGPVGAYGETTLISADGTEFLAYEAHPEGGSDRGVVILPDVRGLHHFYKELALRFAEAGAHAIAIDYFGRTAGLTSRDEEFEYRPHVEKMEFGKVTEDATAAYNALAHIDGVRSIYSVGFCLGGAMSWRSRPRPARTRATWASTACRHVSPMSSTTCARHS